MIDLDTKELLQTLPSPTIILPEFHQSDYVPPSIRIALDSDSMRAPGNSLAYYLKICPAALQLDADSITLVLKEIHFYAYQIGKCIASSSLDAIRPYIANIRDAESTLFIAHIPLVVRLAQKYKWVGFDAADDLLQLGSAAVISAIRSFDISHDTPFFFYARACIRNRMLNYTRSHVGHRWDMLSLDAPISSEDAATYHEVFCANPPEDPSSTYDADAIWKMLDTLPERSRKIMLMYFSDGLPLRIIGQRLGLSHMRIKQIIDEEIMRLRTHIHAPKHGQHPDPYLASD
ncbi:MAG TPA: sigma-70 family RNA polymerase sigma factor [Kiritimatiellia bacterium]|nr:sigma-70 family RNA polymerase sigma factor [Kiritimatiellia bacterium]HMO99624.1 sigma-70 family RNA polymerase sigma factor [Kiritimatiellia bacterium]HMP97129.1 sigma-70 family RNA polymerase sigma factor [Kiritimatiellia bacterium]